MSQDEGVPVVGSCWRFISQLKSLQQLLKANTTFTLEEIVQNLKGGKFHSNLRSLKGYPYDPVRKFNSSHLKSSRNPTGSRIVWTNHDFWRGRAVKTWVTRMTFKIETLRFVRVLGCSNPGWFGFRKSWELHVTWTGKSYRHPVAWRRRKRRWTSNANGAATWRW